MSLSPFVGRDAELTMLDDLWSTPKATLLVVYGRRRVGKTRLLTHWVSRSGHRALYWVAQPTSGHDQLRAFSQAIYNFGDPGAPAPADFTFASWDQAWQQVARLAEQSPLALFVDEFTYLLEADPSLAAVLQHQWDQRLKETQLHLTLCGSHLGMMQRQVVGYAAPLYGRTDAQLKLQPLSFGSTQAYFPDYSAAERVAIYAIFGGIPAYWERIDPRRTVSANIRRQLLSPGSLMHDEPRLLLYDFVREPRNYVALLQAIAHGHTTQRAMASQAGMDVGHASKYLSVLREAGFVERRVSVTDRDDSRRGRYHITDPYLRFYYRFLAPRQAQLALSVVEPALAEVQRHLLDFIGTHAWEEICREWILRAGAHGRLAAMPDQVGSIWTPTAQIDVAGINTREKTLLLGECKWSPKPAGRPVLRGLTTKIEAVVPKDGNWTVDLYGFARGGWTPESTALAAELDGSGARGTNWVLRHVEVLDLASVDADMGRWVR